MRLWVLESGKGGGWGGERGCSLLLIEAGKAASFAGTGDAAADGDCSVDGVRMLEVGFAWGRGEGKCAYR